MIKSQGLSLPQVLVSLALMTAISIPLFQYLWQLQKTNTTLKLKTSMLESLDNQREMLSFEAAHTSLLRKTDGFGLLELLLSLFLASIILLGLMTQLQVLRTHVLSASRQTLQSLELQYVTELMRSSIREAGFTPCMALNKLQVMDTRTGNFNPLALSKPKLNSVLIQRMSSSFDWVISIAEQKELVTTSSHRFSIKRPIIIADCHHAEIHQLDTVRFLNRAQRLVLAKPLMYQFKGPIYVGDWISEHFFVVADGGLQVGYEHARSQEISRLIQAMRVRFDKATSYVLVDIEFKLQDQIKHLITRVRTV